MSMSLAIIAASNAFSYVMTSLRVPTLLAEFLLKLSSNHNVIMLLMLVLMLILGCFMDMGVLILFSTPILYPIAVRFTWMESLSVWCDSRICICHWVVYAACGNLSFYRV